MQNILKLLCLGIIFSSCLAQYPYQLLRTHLLKDYDKFARPVLRASQGITIETSLTPIYLSELDEQTSTMTIEGWIYFKWHDDFLKWDPNSYSGITVISVPNTQIWKPDLTLYNSIPAKNIVELMNAQTNVLVMNDGTIMWVPPGTFSTLCIVKSSNKQICNITIGSWTENVNYIDIKFSKDEIESKFFTNKNPKWKVTSMSAVRQEKIYDCCAEAYVSVVFIFELERIEFNLKGILCGGTLIAIILSLSMFWLPSDSEKKFTLGAVSLLILTMLLHIGSTSPSSLDLTVSFTKVALFIVAAAILVEIVIINIAKMKSPCTAPSFLISGTVGKILLIASDSPKSPPQQEDTEKNGKNTIQFSAPEQKLEHEEWRLIATALDRLFFVIFILIFIIERSV